MERETRVLLEEVRSDVKTIGEQYTSIITKLNEHDQRFIKIEQKLEQHDYRFDRIENKLDQFQQQVGSVLIDHENRIKTLETK